MAENSTSGRSETSRAVLDAIAQLESFENMEIHVRSKADGLTLTGTASEKFKMAAESEARSIAGEGVKLINEIAVPQSAEDDCPDGEKACYCNGSVTCVPISRPCPDCEGGN
jgi:hypothetical protein